MVGMHQGSHSNRRRVVPVERFDLPTFVLQTRCSTAELNRQTRDFDNLIGARNVVAFVVPAINVNGAGAPSNTRLVRQGLLPRKPGNACTKPSAGWYIQFEGITLGWGKTTWRTGCR